MEPMKIINMVIAALFVLCYTYQFFYMPVSWLKKEKRPAPGPLAKRNHYAVLICARNESAVIGDLLESLRRQTWPADRLQVFVMADNCTDDTAEIAARGGAVVYTRTDRDLVGKGYAMEALLAHIREDYPAGFDGYFVFDADNLLEPDYIEQMDRTFSAGSEIVTSYRNSKNYGDNWISAGYALWFLRESRYLNLPRHLLGASCAISGTGFLFSRAVAEEIGGWPFHMLTEDIEFSAYQITRGRKIAFCRDAVFYDEQPTSFRQSWRQRMRWCRGYLQVIGGYGGRLFGGMFRGNFSCFDMTMNIMPAFVLSTASIVCYAIVGVRGLVTADSSILSAAYALKMLQAFYLVPFVMGVITTVSEWRRIRTASAKKVLYLFTFPLFMFTYIPIYISAMVCKTSWKPITHSVTAARTGLLECRTGQTGSPAPAGLISRKTA